MMNLPRTVFLVLIGIVFAAPPAAATAPDKTTPLTIGDTFTIESAVLGETRRINVYAPPGHGGADAAPLPILVMPDGGIGEDFLHVAGLVQVLAGNGGMRPFLLVGIENTERRRDMTGPTANAEDTKIAPRVGGSAAFRRFLRIELMPAIKARYRTTGETAIVGESLAGLFVVETFLREPDLFDTYIAFDPSLWWNQQQLIDDAAALLAAMPSEHKTLYVATSNEPGMHALADRLDAAITAAARPDVEWTHFAMPVEGHQTIYHPAALAAFRSVFKPATGSH